MRTKNHLIKNLFPYFLILAAVICRFLPHPPNFVPIAALALFSGTYLKKREAVIIPLAAMMISDFFLGRYDWRLMALVYFSFLMVAVIGFYLKKHKDLGRVIGGSLAGSVLFFLITNFGVWLFANWYPHNLAGLVQCFTLALPFFRNTLLGDLLYVGLFFGLYEGVLYLLSEREKRRILEPL